MKFFLGITGGVHSISTVVIGFNDVEIPAGLEFNSVLEEAITKQRKSEVELYSKRCMTESLFLF